MPNNSPKYFTLYETAHGVGGVVAEDAGVVEVVLPFGSADAAAMTCRLVDKYGLIVSENEISRTAGRRLVSYFEGVIQNFDVAIAIETTPFRRRVYDIVRAIPYGAVMTYGEVAIAAGSPGAARGVGGAMAANPVPVLIPCHRVIGVNGDLTGFSASGGVASKKWLLGMEAACQQKTSRLGEKFVNL